MDSNGTSDALNTLLSQSWAGMRSNESRASNLKCCCGRQQCAFLEQNNVALEDLEKDLLSAAQIGQALLVRHESHMAEAEAERLRMTANIDQLESEKRELEAANAKIIQENRNLLDKLEDMNNNATEADQHVQALTATLASTRQEMQRLTILAGKAAQLEMQLAELEVEQARLQAQVEDGEEEHRSSLHRWKKAEGTILHLHEQIDRIEREAKAEREKHLEVLQRMERRRNVERELEAAGARLKGAAASAAISKQPNGTNVVSHFVKDILQDNANLQTGIVELRDMLMSSNAEVESLREQLQLHQPVDAAADEELSLVKELEPATIAEPSTAALPDLHVHHHYHAPERIIVRPKKRRAINGVGRYANSSGTSTPARQSIRDWQSGPRSSSSTILAQTSVSIPPSNRWSVQSHQTGSSFSQPSVPSSPGSGWRSSSSVFDSIDNAFGSSVPTTPGSSAPSSPPAPVHDPKTQARAGRRITSAPMPLKLRPAARHDSISSLDRLLSEAPGTLQDNSSTPKAKQPLERDFKEELGDPPVLGGFTHDDSEFIRSPDLLSPHEIIVEELESDSVSNTEPSELSEPPEPSYLAELSLPTLRRAASHESIMSMSGMDIHTLKSRPSQLLSGRGLPPRKLYSMPSPTTATLSSSTAIVSPTTAVGTPTFNSSDYTRSLLAQRRSTQDDKSAPTLGARVGGWVWGKWGVAPSASVENLRAKAASPPSPAEAFFARPPGVNQIGPIKGLRPPPKTPSNVVPKVIDTSLLLESLEESS